MKAVKQTIARNAFSGDTDYRHHREWIAACKGGPTPYSNFEIAGYLTEIILLAVWPAHRQETGMGRPEHARHQRPEAAQFVKRQPQRLGDLIGLRHRRPITNGNPHLMKVRVSAFLRRCVHPKSGTTSWLTLRDARIGAGCWDATGTLGKLAPRGPNRRHWKNRERKRPGKLLRKNLGHATVAVDNPHRRCSAWLGHRVVTSIPAHCLMPACECRSNLAAIPSSKGGPVSSPSRRLEPVRVHSGPIAIHDVAAPQLATRTATDDVSAALHKRVERGAPAFVTTAIRWRCASHWQAA